MQENIHNKSLGEECLFHVFVSLQKSIINNKYNSIYINIGIFVVEHLLHRGAKAIEKPLFEVSLLYVLGACCRWNYCFHHSVCLHYQVPLWACSEGSQLPAEWGPRPTRWPQHLRLCSWKLPWPTFLQGVVGLEGAAGSGTDYELQSPSEKWPELLTTLIQPRFLYSLFFLNYTLGSIFLALLQKWPTFSCPSTCRAEGQHHPHRTGSGYPRYTGSPSRSRVQCSQSSFHCAKGWTLWGCREAGRSQCGLQPLL